MLPLRRAGSCPTCGESMSGSGVMKSGGAYRSERGMRVRRVLSA